MNKFLIIGLFAFSLLVPINSFAIDYVDSSGYTPSWAKGQGYHYVLNECNYMIGDTSRDGNWCYEWVAYVLDQGFENFPQSTQGTSSTSKVNPQSERVCTENKICAFPGEFLKYKTWDTFDGFEEIAVVEFKEKINSDNIRFFSDGFGSKPLTYNLNLKTGIETHDEYTGVNRPFNFIEPIPMEKNQKVFRYFENYYDAKITNEKIVDLGEIGLSFGKRTVMGAEIIGSNGDITILGYDKETGILITQMEKYHFDNEEFIAGVLLIDTNIFSVPTKIAGTNSVTKSNDSTISNPIIKPKSNPIVSGDYLEEISIVADNNEYFVSGKLGEKSPNVSSIRIIAENECPFKKQVFLKDFLYKPGDEVSFSFHQFSTSKPEQCSIHFTISNFDGIELETIDASYYLEEPETQNQKPLNEHPFAVQPKSLEPKEKVPTWVKNNAKWWSEGNVNDQTFVNGIAFLVKEKILSIEKSDLISNSQFIEKQSTEFYLVDTTNYESVPTTVNISWDGNYGAGDEIPFEIAFYDENRELIQDVRYVVSFIDVNDEVIETFLGDDPKISGILATEGIDVKKIYISSQGAHRIDVQVLGTGISYDESYAGIGSGIIEIGDSIQKQLVKSPIPKSTEIPSWIKNNAGWWADGMISEDDFLKGITYMVEKGIIRAQ